MRALLQKVSSASVRVGESVVGEIRQGYLLFLCVMQGDSEEHVRKLAEKICKLRLWEGEGGKINDRSILDVRGEILVVSQFTLAGRTEKGNRPDYTQAAPVSVACPLYAQFPALLQALGIHKVAVGQFGAAMQVTLTNEGPVTLMLET
jgi:D-tyrosyl-tRNA(Tyr) deacylase